MKRTKTPPEPWWTDSSKAPPSSLPPREFKFMGESDIDGLVTIAIFLLVIGFIIGIFVGKVLSQ